MDGTGKGDPQYHIADESFAIKHDAVGVLAMANNGEPTTAGTQVRLPVPRFPSFNRGHALVLGGSGSGQTTPSHFLRL